MIEKLKDLEQEALDNLDPEVYDEITSNVLGEGEQWIYQSGYIDGLQTAIRLLSENDSNLSYSVEIEDIEFIKDIYDDEDNED
tara:strand:+ start:387 stop:635 length:249 start_codon:yes stop_codon:yes gene_type:complete